MDWLLWRTLTNPHFWKIAHLYHLQSELSCLLYRLLSTIVSKLRCSFHKVWFVFLNFSIQWEQVLFSNLCKPRLTFFIVDLYLDFSNLAFWVLGACVIVSDQLIPPLSNVSSFVLLLSSYFSSLLWFTWTLCPYWHGNLVRSIRQFEGILTRNFEWLLILVSLS